jgi:NhaP-type Na+/H+ or K+/H+ antiporter
MSGAAWYLVIGLLLLLITFVSGVVKRLPLSTPLVYLVAGLILGLTHPGPFKVLQDSHFVERMAEAVVIVSLFTAGLKLRAHGSGRSWNIPLRLASVSMLLTISLVTLIGAYLLKLPLGIAVLLSAVLAPTDPVLASEVQVEKAGDEDPVRHSLTGEAGLNDGAAFPFVMLGLGLLGLHPLGWSWLIVDLLWAIGGGLLIGAALGHLVGRAVLYLRMRHREAVGLDEFLTLGLIAASYGLAVIAHAYGFLAVFAAGVALRNFETRSGRTNAPPDVRAAALLTDGAATHPAHAPAYMAEATLSFNEKLERILELGSMIVVGMLLARVNVSWPQLGLMALLLGVVRPISVWLGLLRTKSSRLERSYIGFFGIRGIGSLYYLYFAATHGLDERGLRTLSGFVLVTIASSVVLHGVSVTPLMGWYRQRQGRRVTA